MAKRKMPKCIAVETKAGILKAYESTDPNYPGICIMLQPTGSNYEIDVAAADVHEQDYDSQDVHVYIWADVTQEDVTNSWILTRSDIEKHVIDSED